MMESFPAFKISADEPCKLTHDGFVVPPEYMLLFHPFSAQRLPWDGTLIAVSIEWQQDGKQKRPYATIHLGSILIQIGWLWVNPNL